MPEIETKKDLTDEECDELIDLHLRKKDEDKKTESKQEELPKTAPSSLILSLFFSDDYIKSLKMPNNNDLFMITHFLYHFGKENRCETKLLMFARVETINFVVPVNKLVAQNYSGVCFRFNANLSSSHNLFELVQFIKEMDQNFEREHFYAFFSDRENEIVIIDFDKNNKIELN